MPPSVRSLVHAIASRVRNRAFSRSRSSSRCALRRSFVANFSSASSSLAPQDPAQPSPVILAERSRVERPVLRLEEPVGIDRRMVVADLARHLAVGEIALALHTEETHQSRQQRGLDPLTFARVVPLGDRCRDGDRTPHAGGEIADGHAVAGRLATRMAGDAHHTRHALRDLVEAGPAAIGTGPAHARDAAVDDLRVRRPDVVVAEAHRLGRPRLEVLDHDIGLRRDPAHRLKTRFVAKIDSEAALVAVDAEEIDRDIVVVGA